MASAILNDATTGLTITPSVNTNNTGVPAAIQTIASATPTNMQALNLPNQSETAYLRCFARFDQAGPTLVTSAITNLANSFASQGNATLGGNAAQVTGLFTLVGSFVFASLI